MTQTYGVTGVSRTNVRQSALTSPYAPGVISTDKLFVPDELVCISGQTNRTQNFSDANLRVTSLTPKFGVRPLISVS